MQTPPRSIADNIRAEMARHRVTQRDLAAALDLSPAGINRRLTGFTRISADELVSIASALGVKPAQLLDGAA